MEELGTLARTGLHPLPVSPGHAEARAWSLLAG